MLNAYLTIKDALSGSGSSLLFTKKSIKKAEQYLRNGETILAAVTVAIVGATVGVMVLTDQRIFVCSSSMGDTVFKEIALPDIKTISTIKIENKMIIYGNLVTIEVTGVRWSQADYLNPIINEAKELAIYRCRSFQPAQTSTFTPQDIQTLRELDQLRMSGIITNEEFKAKKRQILNL